jgi:hypothetical protein
MRVLALDVRPRKAGFAVFEGSRLLDWGVKTYGNRGASLGVTVSGRINGLLDLHSPTLVVLQKRTHPAAAGALPPIMEVVRMETMHRSIGLRLLSTETVKRFYIGLGCTTKQQIATAVAGWYPELRWKLPPKRRTWESENHNMTLFDAAAVGVCFVRGVNETPR